MFSFLFTPNFLSLGPCSVFRRQAKSRSLACFLQNSRAVELWQSQNATELVSTHALILMGEHQFRRCYGTAHKPAWDIVNTHLIMR